MIKWREEDVKKLKKLVKDFNEKVNSSTGKQPKPIKYRELVNNIRERSDYNRIYNKYSRYLKEGAEQKHPKYNATKWEVNEFNIAKSQINKTKKREAKKLRPKTYIGTSTTESDRYKPITRGAESIENFDRYLKHLERQQSTAYNDRLNKQFALNYRAALLDQFGNNEVLAQVLESSPFIQIEFVYDDNQELELRENLVLREWESIMNEYSNL